MRVCITGATGTVGSELTKLFKSRQNSYELIYLDRSHGIDITDKSKVKEVISKSDAVIHLAAVIDPNNPKLWEVNVEGTKNIVESLDGQYLIHISTCEVTNPITEYEKSKAEAEKIVKSYENKCIVRLPLLLAPNKYWKSIFKYICKGFPILGNGKQKWQLLDWRDAAESIYFLFEKQAQGLYIVAWGYPIEFKDDRVYLKTALP
jgi:nucleoside-diphosphate-sugar epimerase